MKLLFFRILLVGLVICSGCSTVEKRRAVALVDTEPWVVTDEVKASFQNKVEKCLNKTFEQLSQDRMDCIVIGVLMASELYGHSSEEILRVYHSACGCDAQTLSGAASIAIYLANSVDQHGKKYSLDSVERFCAKGDQGVCDWLADRKLAYD